MKDRQSKLQLVKQRILNARASNDMVGGCSCVWMLHDFDEWMKAGQSTGLVLAKLIHIHAESRRSDSDNVDFVVDCQ